MGTKGFWNHRFHFPNSYPVGNNAKMRIGQDTSLFANMSGANTWSWRSQEQSYKATVSNERLVKMKDLFFHSRSSFKKLREHCLWHISVLLKTQTILMTR